MQTSGRNIFVWNRIIKYDVSILRIWESNLQAWYCINVEQMFTCLLFLMHKQFSCDNYVIFQNLYFNKQFIWGTMPFYIVPLCICLCLDWSAWLCLVGNGVKTKCSRSCDIEHWMFWNLTGSWLRDPITFPCSANWQHPAPVLRVWPLIICILLAFIDSYTSCYVATDKRA